MRRAIIIGVVIVLFILGLIWAINRREASPVQEEAVPETALIDYADTTNQVRYIMRGRINAREDHRVLTITVGRNGRTAVISEGYNGRIVKAERLGNDSAAYKQFLAAIANEGFTDAREASSSIVPDGACPKGRRYDFEVVQGGELKQSLWTTSCGRIDGTFAGDNRDIEILFEQQIPEYDEFVKGIQF